MAEACAEEEMVDKVGTRGRRFVGTVVRAAARKTVVVEWPRLVYLRKYERYAKRRTRVQVHVPDGVNVAVGDVVNIGECRPVSKTKHFVILGKVES